MGYLSKLFLQISMVWCFCQANNSSLKIVVPTAVTQEIPLVTNLRATFALTDINLAWDRSEEVYFVAVSRGDEIISRDLISNNQFIVKNCTRNQEYHISVFNSFRQTISGQAVEANIYIPNNIFTSSDSNRTSFQIRWLLSKTKIFPKEFTILTKPYGADNWTSHYVPTADCLDGKKMECIYHNTNTTSSTVYQYIVRAIYDNGFDEAQGVLNTEPFPGQSEKPKVTIINSTIARVSWDPINNPGNEIKHYELFRISRWLTNLNNVNSLSIVSKFEGTTFDDNHRFEVGKNYTYALHVTFKNKYYFYGAESNWFVGEYQAGPCRTDVWGTVRKTMA